MCGVDRELLFPPTAPIGIPEVILINDPRVTGIPVHESGEPLVAVPEHLLLDPARPAVVRRGVLHRLGDAAAPLLRSGRRLAVVEGHRSAAAQSAIIEAYRARLRAALPDVPEVELDDLVSRHVAPLDNAPHVAGAAVDLTLTDRTGRQLRLGAAVDATPEDSGGRCYTAAALDDRDAAENRAALVGALSAAGLVNYPAEWWHWSHGDRYWAFVTGAQHAVHGPVAGVPA